jgi:hypothetical protein
MRHLPAAGELTPYGELLITGPVLSQMALAFAGAPTAMTWTIPEDPALLGLDVYVQGFCRAAPRPVRGKIQLVRGRLSNALDLVLGY